MSWEPMTCADTNCRAESWLVQRPAEQTALWHIAASVDDRPFSVAAAAPVCPYCGTTLAAADTLEQDARSTLRETLRPARAFASATR